MAQRVHLSRRRQASKPLLERQRRARINRSLEELKGLVLSSLYRDQNDPSFQKMEKAEILELTVNFLKMIRQQQMPGHCCNSNHSDSMTNYRAGFNDCASKVCSFIENQPQLDTKVREQILVRLAASCNLVKSDGVHYSNCVPEVYASQNLTEYSSYCCVSSPPPSPPSSAFTPYQANSDKAVQPIESGSQMVSRGSHRSNYTNKASGECKLPLWRPWISSSENQVDM